MCLAQGNNILKPVRLEPAAPQSRINLSTTALPNLAYVEMLFWPVEILNEIAFLSSAAKLNGLGNLVEDIMRIISVKSYLILICH